MMRHCAAVAMAVACVLLLTANAGAQQPAVAAPGVKVVPVAARCDLNKAGLEDLVTVPGIGPKTARLILDLRAKKGTFLSVEDLLEVKGIGEKSLAKMKNHLYVSPAPSSAPKKVERQEKQ